MKWTLQDPGEWFEESSPSLLISEERIEAKTAVGENIRGKLKIETTNGRKVRGSISVSEALAIQSLPANFVLPTDITLTDAFKTIGNGVPFVAAHGIAETIYDYIHLHNPEI